METIHASREFVNKLAALVGIDNFKHDVLMIRDTVFKCNEHKWPNANKEFEMTREEARKIVFDKYKSLEGKESGYLIDVLEALGLIKFDKPKRLLINA